MLLKDRRGYTLVELLIVMVIFVVIIMVTSSGFKTVLSQMGQQTKSMETEIGSIIGLELLRSDLQGAGYGLPFTFQSAPGSYTEITSDSGMPVSGTFWEAGKSPTSYNDATGNAPRAVQSGNTTFNYDTNNRGAQYLVLKSMSVAPGATQKKWINVTYSDSGKSATTWGSADRNFIASERVIVIRNTFKDGILDRQLQVNQASGGAFASTFSQYTTLAQPHSSGDVFQVYGVDSTVNPRMPFNRADYYVNTPAKMPPACAPNTGILYKAVANQAAAGGFTEIPLMDCVADMQVAYGLGPVGSTVVNLHQTPLPTSFTAQDIREQVKEIRVYILAHEGKKDTGFTYPNQLVDVGENFGGGLLGRSFDLNALIGNGWRNYRWKLYTIVVRPKNLIQ